MNSNGLVPAFQSPPAAREGLWSSMQALLFDDLPPGGAADAVAFMRHLFPVPGVQFTRQQIRVHNCLGYVACFSPTIVTVAWHQPTRRWWFTGLDLTYRIGDYTPQLSLPPSCIQE